MGKMIEFSELEIRTRMELDNPWWNNDSITGVYESLQPRPYIDLFYELVTLKKIKRAVVLMGPRRVGKTVMIYHTIKKLINDGVNPKHILYLSIDTPIYNGLGLEQLINIYGLRDVKTIRSLKYVFFDEVQYLKKWEVHLKSLVDTYVELKFVVSGSAAAALKLQSDESGAGRFTDFTLPPLTFYEYILLKKIHIKIERNEKELFYSTDDIGNLNEHFLDYINYGGYPEVALSDAIKNDQNRYVKSDIIDKVLLKDLPGLYGIQDVQELNSLFSVICYNTGNEISLEQLSKNSGVAKNTIIRYLQYLEAAFLIKRYHRVDQNAKRFKRKTFFKVYLANPSMRAATFFPIKKEDPFMGNMVETAIFSQWVHSLNADLYYARWEKAEIDIISIGHAGKPGWAVEIKWSDRYVTRPGELSHQLRFCENHKIKELLVTTETKTSNQNLYDIEVVFIPAALYCYTVGKNLIETKSIRNSLSGLKTNEIQ